MKKSHLPRCVAFSLALVGGAVAVALWVAPDRTRAVWRSLHAKVEAWSTAKAEPDADEPAARPMPPDTGSELPRVKAAPASSGKPLVQPASARKRTAARVASPKTEAARQPVMAPDVLVAQLPPQAKAKAGPGEEKLAAAAPAATAPAAGPFEFPADEAGRLLADRLTPPRDVPLAPTPFVRQPQSRPVGMPDDLKPHMAKLPAADSGAATVVVGAERRSPQRGQPAHDRPPLAAEADPERPQRVLWPAAPLAYAASPNPEATPQLRYIGLPVADAVTPQDDPTADSARVALLAGTSVPMPVAPPPLRLTIPDPFEHARVVQLANPPAERDPPEPSFQRPQPPLLPVPEVAKKKP